MARRLALLAVLACAAALHRPHYSPDSSSDSASYDSFSLFDDYDESFDTTPKPRPNKMPSKVILRGQRPKVNVSFDNVDSEDKQKIVKTTNIKIESHTNFIVTKKPVYKPSVPNKGTHRPVVQVGDQYFWVDVDGEQFRPTSKKPTTRRTTTAAATRRPTTRRPTTTRRPPTTTRRRPPAVTPPRPSRATHKTTKPPPTRKTTCPPKSSGWLSSFIKDDNMKKATTPKPKPKPKPKPTKSGWFLGFFSRLYKWISDSIFGGSWFDDSTKEKSSTMAPTTPSPSTTTSKTWYQAFLDTDDKDEDYVTETSSNKKISSKKSEKKYYRGFKLIRAYLDVRKKVNDMLELKEEGQGSGLMWWTPPALNSSTDLLVPPDLMADVKEYLKNADIDYEIVIWNLQKAIAYENPSLSLKQRRALEQLNGHPMTWRRYHRYADILRYLEYLQHSYADMIELIPLGRSSEGLPLVAVKVSLPMNETQKSGSSKDKKQWKLRSRMKPVVWLDGGAHAREWIAPAVATWMLHALVEGDKGLGADYKLLEQADFYIMPVMNPDGYEHSHTHDRLWKKTRSRQPDRSDDYFIGWFQWWKSNDCVGVDADRNWDYKWGKQDSSQDPCDENYAGPHPFSEPETRAVSEFLTEHRRRIKVYISLHAYTQAWIVPSTESDGTTSDGELMEMGELATAALADTYSTKYQVGTVAQIRQAASGMSHDWAKTRAGIPFSYHVDLRDSFGPYGFLLPGAKITSTALETWMAVKAIVDNLNPA